MLFGGTKSPYCAQYWFTEWPQKDLLEVNCLSTTKGFVQGGSTTQQTRVHELSTFWVWAILVANNQFSPFFWLIRSSLRRLTRDFLSRGEREPLLPPVGGRHQKDGPGEGQRWPLA